MRRSKYGGDQRPDASDSGVVTLTLVVRSSTPTENVASRTAVVTGTFTPPSSTNDTPAKLELTPGSNP
jgi:hypothetical protein